MKVSLFYTTASAKVSLRTAPTGWNGSSRVVAWVGHSHRVGGVPGWGAALLWLTVGEDVHGSC